MNQLRSRLGTLTIVFAGVVGLLASFILTIDKIKLLENPSFVPACSLNPVISCLSAMSSLQSEILGKPNSLFGIILYTAVVVVGILLVLKVALPGVIWKTMLFFGIVGFLFVHYLIFQSLFVIHVICPWCLTIWLTTPLLFLALFYEYTQRIEINIRPLGYRLIVVIAKQRIMIGALWYALLFAAVGYVFRDYWASLL